ncbi:MAG: zinc ribbon domain-containing protein [Clostridia bacterium]|nr:zinc ribbon domain-containing protein [Clostridia bacterium]
MFCSNCGTKNSNDAQFCTNCGARLSAAVIQQSSAEQVTLGNQTASNNQVGQSPVITEAPKTDFEFNPEPKKKSAMAPLIIIAAVLICVIGFLFKDIVLAAVAPKLYASNVLTKTVEQIADESEEAEKNILGFNIGKEKDLTVDLEATLNEIGSLDLENTGFKITAAKSDSKKKLMYGGEFIYDGKSIISALAMLDNKNIYVDVPELFEKSLGVPSKKFGKAWNESEIAKESGVELSEDLDLSYSNLMKKDEFFTKDTIKALEKEIKNLIQVSELEKSKGSATVNGKSVKTRTLAIAIDPDELSDYFTESINIIEDDENLQELLANSDAEDTLDEAFSEMKTGLKEACNYIDDAVVLKMQVYKGRVVEFAVELKVEDVEVRVGIAFEDSSTFINNVVVRIEVKEYDEEMLVEAISKGNHIGKGKVYTDETVVKVITPDGEEMELVEHTLTIDMKKNVYEQALTVNADGEEGGIALEGTCSNKKEFKLTLEKIKFKGELDDEVPAVKGKLGITIRPKAKFEKVNTSKTLNILEADEQELENWAENVEENAEKFMEKNEELFESDFGEAFGFDSGYDDYYYN